jgi:signal transduction histidine kinase
MRFANLSLHIKILFTVVSITMIALVLTCAPLLFSNIQQYGEVLTSVQNLQFQAEDAAEESIDAVLDKDKGMANEVLELLSEEDSVTGGALLNDEGKIIATNLPDVNTPKVLETFKEASTILRFQGTYYTFHHHILDIYVPIKHNDELIGVMYVRSHLEPDSNFDDILQILFLVLVLIFLLTGALQKNITSPLVRLRDLMRDFSDSNNYKLRAKEDSHDEIGELASGFNKMLVALEAHEGEQKKAYRQLQETQAQLVQSSKLASLGEMTAGIAHEINNPLFFIKGFNDRIRKIFSKNEVVTYDMVEDYVVRIADNVDRMAKIIRHFKDFSRQSGDEHVPVKVIGVVEETLSFIGEQIQKHNIKVNVDYQDELVVVKGNVIRLEQVFINLLNNARDALDGMEDNKDKQINISSRHEDGKLILEFVDNGPGIPAEVLAKMFDPFFTTKEVGKGTGLGLSISHTIISEHYGEISFHSEGEGLGTTCRIVLPIVDGPAQ